MNEFEKKVLKLVVEIIKGCQDLGKDVPFSEDKLRSLRNIAYYLSTAPDKKRENLLVEENTLLARELKLVQEERDRLVVEKENLLLELQNQKQAKARIFSDNKLLEVINKDLSAEVDRLKDVLLAVYSDRDFYKAEMNELTEDYATYRTKTEADLEALKEALEVFESKAGEAIELIKARNMEIRKLFLAIFQGERNYRKKSSLEKIPGEGSLREIISVVNEMFYSEDNTESSTAKNS